MTKKPLPTRVAVDAVLKGRAPLARRPVEERDDSDWESLILDGIAAREAGDNAKWLLGDLAGQVETTYGEADLDKYADRIGVSYSSLRDYKRVAVRFVERSTNLTWSHYRIVAGRDDAEALLSQALRERWSVAQLRDVVADYKRLGPHACTCGRKFDDDDELELHILDKYYDEGHARADDVLVARENALQRWREMRREHRARAQEAERLAKWEAILFWSGVRLWWSE